MRPFEHRLRVRSYELDALGHVNHAVYLSYFEDARFQALEEAGFPPSRIRDEGWGVVVVRVEVDYLKECRQGDRLLARTRAESFKRTSMVLVQELLVEAEDAEDGAVPAARARVTAVWVDDEGRPMRIPEPIRVAFGETRSPE